MTIPSFETSRLHIREMVESDASLYEKHFVDYEIIGQLTPIVPWPYPTGGILEYFKKDVLPFQGHDKWVWAINLKNNPNEVIGNIDLRRKGSPENRGFWLGHKYWGKGYMTEAIIPVMDYAFGELGFERMTFANARGNIRSRRVKEKTGSRLIRTEPAKYNNPQYHEREVWELTKEDWTLFRSKSN